MPLTAEDVDFIRGIVAEHSGNVIAPRQVHMLEQRLTPVAHDVGADDVEQLVSKLRKSHDRQLSTQVAEAVTVNETSFFRDLHLFTALEKAILPGIIENNAAERKLRIWSAASSSGQEAYSTAMVIRENFPEITDWDVQILATDIAEDMLRKSRSGEYSQLEVNRGLPVRKLVRFFDRAGANWRAKDELRNMIEHRRLNLTQSWPFLGKFDVVMMRNVLIYFDQTTKAGILDRVQRTLKPEGHFFVGSAEILLGSGVPFERHEIHGTVSYRPKHG